MVPDRAGADTRVDVIIPLRDLLGMDGASVIEDTWLRARAGEHGYLTGKDAQAAACDALIVPVVTGSPDWTVIGQMIALVTGAYPHADAAGDPAGRPQPLPPEAWEALQYALARLAIQFVSGPGALASALRRSLLGAPLNTKSVPLDIGYSATIPEPIRTRRHPARQALRLVRRLRPKARRHRRPPRQAQERRRPHQRQGLRSSVQLSPRRLRPPPRLEIRAPARRIHPRHQPRRQNNPPQPPTATGEPTQRLTQPARQFFSAATTSAVVSTCSA